MPQFDIPKFPPESRIDKKYIRKAFRMVESGFGRTSAADKERVNSPNRTEGTVRRNGGKCLYRKEGVSSKYGPCVIVQVLFNASIVAGVVGHYQFVEF